MNQSGKQEDYVWVIVERQGQQESFLGLASQGGGQFIPVTAERDQGLMLLGRLPAPAAGVVRELETIHKDRLSQQAAGEGFAVFLVDAQGKILSRLGDPPA